MTLPAFTSKGYLPGGDHEAGWDEVSARFGAGRRRQEILVGLHHVVERLVAHGVRQIWLDGSFVTDKLRPSDVDVLYKIEPGGDRTDWPDVGKSQRRYVKQNHRVDLWRYPSPQPAKNTVGFGAQQRLITMHEFFSSDAEEEPKGMVKLDILEWLDDQEPQAAEDSQEELGGPEGNS